jgi:hypothetical protein
MKYLILLLSSTILLSCSKPQDKTFIVTKVRSASKLATTEVILNKIVWTDIQGRKKYSIFKDKKMLMFNTEATLKLGVNLSKLNENDIMVFGDSLVITLPKVEILNFSYPHEKYEELYPSDFNGITNNKTKVEQLDMIFREAETDIRNKVKYLGLETITEQKTRQFLSKFMAQSNYNNVVIKFKQ